MSTELEDKIKTLKAQMANLQEQIVELEQEEQYVRLADFYADECERIVCPLCNGEGVLWGVGAAILSDPPYDEPCDACGARGWHWAQVWQSRKRHEVPKDARVASLDVY